MKKYIYRLAFTVIFITVAVLLYKFNIGCPVKSLIGICCPSCGMTRACLCALRFDFINAFYYHPLFILTPVVWLLFIFYDKLSKKTAVTIGVSLLAVFLGVYFLRLLVF